MCVVRRVVMERNKAMTRKQFDKWATKREKLLREIGNLCRHLGTWAEQGIWLSSDLDKIVDRAKRLRKLEQECKL